MTSPSEPGQWLEALRLAVALYANQDVGEGAVLHTAGEFHDRLTRGQDIPSGTTREILTTLHTMQETIMTALQSLQAADDSLKAEVTSAITDWAAQLAAANSANDPAIQAVADDMNQQVAALQAADSGNAGTSTTGTATPPATGTGGDAGGGATPAAAPTPGTSN